VRRAYAGGFELIAKQSLRKCLINESFLELVAEIRDQHTSEWAATNQVSQLLGVGSGETVRKWVRQAEGDAGPARAPPECPEKVAIKALRRSPHRRR
jgi:transposase